MKHKHITSKKSKYVSLLIIPQSKKIKQINIATWIPKTLILLSLVLFISISYYVWDLYTSYNFIKNDYEVKVNKLTTLKKINQKQKDRISKLNQKTAEIESKLNSIYTLQKTVKDMVGLEDNKKSLDTALSSRSTDSLVRALNQNNNFSEKNLETCMNELSQLLDQEKTDLNTLICDVEERLEYLEAKPNLMPTTGKITSGFGYRKNPFGSGRQFHYGIDIANRSNTKIKAAGKGVVIFAGYKVGYGNAIILSHGYGYQSIYGHSRKLLVDVGDKVDKGDIIALMGNSGKSTGTHLHFEIKYYGKSVDPIKIIGNKE